MQLSERVLAQVKDEYPWYFSRALDGHADILEELIKAVVNRTALDILNGDGDF